MMTTLIFTLLTTFSFAAEEQTPLVELPDYKSDFEKIEQDGEKTMAEKKEEPNSLFKRIEKEVQTKASDISKYVNDKRKELSKIQQAKQKEFEATAKKELDKWRESNPGKSATAFMMEQGNRRKQLFQQLRAEKESAELSLADRKKHFDEYIKAFKISFKQRFSNYTSAFRAANTPKETKEEKEFKEIPKDKGTKLSPGKE